MPSKNVAKIEIRELREGTYEARCLELGLVAQGSSMAEAEASVLRLIDERTEQLGVPLIAVASERDTRLEPSDEDVSP